MAKQEDQNEQLGQLAGLGAGALLGAQVGSIIPGPGTVVGAVVGGALGSQFGKNVGGTVLNIFGFGSSKKSSGPTSNEMMMQLERLSQMRAQGLLSEEEFAAAKSQLLGL